MKFEHAPGLPGYGTKGVDGSAGLPGIATYFSSYDGISDSITIKSKIISNKILFPVDKFIAGYPTRVYQTGDQIIDRNGRVFQIDFGETNLYKTTGQQLNTSGFFEEGSATVQTPTYSRYSNAYTAAKFLIDVVYAAVPPGNYASNPNMADGSIYGIGAIDFAQIKFVENNINGYHPFTIYTNTSDITKPERAFAIVKEDARNTWHMGNADAGGLLRDVSLVLDFKDIYFKGNVGAIHSTGDISTNGTIYGNRIYGNSARITGDASVGTLNVLGTTQAYGVFTSYQGITFNGTTDASNLITATGFKNINVKTPTQAGTNSSGSIFVTTGNILGTDIVPAPVFLNGAGSFEVSTGNGRNSVSAANVPGGGGKIALYSGIGGSNSILAADASGGKGGFIEIRTGDGGNGLLGGYGGDVSILTGNGGNAIDPSTSNTTLSGRGGDFQILTGKGGSNANSFYPQAGRGGDIILSTGEGTTGYVSGRGGDIFLYPGPDGTGSFTSALAGKIILGYGSGGSFLGQTYLPNGSAAVPAITFHGGTTGIYCLTSPTKFSISEGATGCLSIYSTGAIRSLETIGEGRLKPVDSIVNGYHLNVEGGYCSGGVSNGGNLNLKGGDSYNGGHTYVYGGNHDSGHDGGNVYVEAGGAGTPVYNGGSVFLKPGTGTSSDGNLYFQNLLLSASATLNHLAINVSDVVFRSTITVSDLKYKNLKGNIDDSLSKILNINGYYFNWNEKSKEIFDIVDTNELQSGLVAQEVEKVFPELVGKQTEKGNEFKTVHYEKFVPYLVEAIKDQQKQIDELKEIIKIQQAQIQSLLNK